MTAVGESDKPTPQQQAQLATAVRETVKDAIFEKRPYLKMAFSNPYNLSLLFR